MVNKPQIDSSAIDIEQLEYDKHAGFYYTNLINSIILFSLTGEELEKLAAQTFDPLFEMESEIDYAFTPVCFDTIFRNGLIDHSIKSELVNFKQETDHIPQEIWAWDYLDNSEAWLLVRQKAKELLDKLAVKDRVYNEDYTTVYDREGNVLRKGKNVRS